MLRRTESPARQPADRFMWPTMARGRVGGGGTSSSPLVRRCLFLHKYNYNNIYTHTRRASNKHNYNKYYKNILFINAAAAAAVTPRRYCNTPAALVILLCIYDAHENTIIIIITHVAVFSTRLGPSPNIYYNNLLRASPAHYSPQPNRTKPQTPVRPLTMFQ